MRALVAVIAVLGLTWSTAHAYQKCAAANDPTSPFFDAIDAVRRWVLPFLEVYLAGDTSFAPFLAPITGPGIVFEQAH